MKILIVGDFRSEVYEKAFYKSFKKLGYETYQFNWFQYFKEYLDNNNNSNIKSLYYAIQNKFLFGTVIHKINKDLLSFCKKIEPDLVFIYRGICIFSKTINGIREIGSKVFGYNNDDPFSKLYPKYFWRHYKKSIPNYDFIFAYREKNIKNYEKIGYKKVNLLMPYYIKERNYYISNLLNSKYKSDISFMGHFEDDGRDEYIKCIIDNNFDFRLFGPEWHRSKYYSFFKERFGEITSVFDDYNLAINSTKIALVFLSKLNSDTYTRRCFEIPATKTFMLCEYSDDLNNIFKEGIEAEYFRKKEEMIRKIKFYLSNDEKRIRITNAGYKKLMISKHEVTDRIKTIIKVYEKL